MAARTKKKGKPDLPVFDVIAVGKKEGGDFPIHFVGLRYYTVQSFIKEAKEIGVSRALPANVLKSFNWGDRIFLAIHIKEQSEDGKTTIPTAVVFGYFTIEWVNFKGTPRLHAAVATDPRLKAKTTPLPTPVHENRGCGDYAITAVTTVGKDVTLAMLVQVVQEHARKFGDKFKLMAGGRFVQLKPAKLRGVKFTQNVTWVGLPDAAADFIFSQIDDDEEVPAPVFPHGAPKPSEPHIEHVKNYKLRKPAVRKGEAENLFDFLTDDKEGVGRDD